MKRIDAATGLLISVDELRKRLNASIPEDADLSAEGFPAVSVDNYPALAAHEEATLGQPFNDQGTWRQSWNVIAKTLDYDVTINRHQAKIVLLNHGLLDQVNALMEHADPAMVIAWTEAPAFRRNSPTLLAMAVALKLDEKQVDALFAEALAVNV